MVLKVQDMHFASIFALLNKASAVEECDASKAQFIVTVPG